jgi:hypothetical protein
VQQWVTDASDATETARIVSNRERRQPDQIENLWLQKIQPKAKHATKEHSSGNFWQPPMIADAEERLLEMRSDLDLMLRSSDLLLPCCQREEESERKPDLGLNPSQGAAQQHN